MASFKHSPGSSGPIWMTLASYIDECPMNVFFIDPFLQTNHTHFEKTQTSLFHSFIVHKAKYEIHITQVTPNLWDEHPLVAGFGSPMFFSGSKKHSSKKKVGGEWVFP